MFREFSQARGRAEMRSLAPVRVWIEAGRPARLGRCPVSARAASRVRRHRRQSSSHATGKRIRALPMTLDYTMVGAARVGPPNS